MFERFPDLLFSNLRRQMLLGRVPAQTVLAVLEPLLSNFHELMPQLQPEVQTDFENILRIYPDVAESRGISVKPPVPDSLNLFAEYWSQRRRSTPAPFEFDMAAEPQQKLESPGMPFVSEGQGFFGTDKGNSVYLEFFYSDEDDCAFFECRPLSFAVEIHICGIHMLTLTPSEPKQKIQADRLFDILKKCSRKISVKVIEAEVKPNESGDSS